VIVADQRRTRGPEQAWRPFLLKPPRTWIPDIIMGVAFVLWTIPLVWASPLVDLDIWIRDLCDSFRPPWAEGVATLTNMFGQGGLLGSVSLGLAALLAVKGRNVRPLIAFLAAYFMTGAILILKDLLPRNYPHWPRPLPGPYADAAQAVLFSGLDPSGAYPSGHVLNTIVWYGFIIFLVGSGMKPWQRGLLRYVPPVIVTFSTTYLGFHWFTDTPAGLFIGVVILRIVQRIPWATVELPLWLEPEKRYR